MGHSGSKERLNAPLSQYHSVSTSFDFSTKLSLQTSAISLKHKMIEYLLL